MQKLRRLEKHATVKTFIVRISSKCQERLERLVEKTKKPESFHVGKMLEMHLDEYEESCIAMERASAENARYFTSNEVRKLIGLHRGHDRQCRQKGSVR